MNGKNILKISSGARRIGSLIKNEECERKDYALFKGISLAQVAALFGYTPDRVSVNAINRGNAVEK
ncbi:MAG: hypothetical protein VX278_20310, partial [Myxococcota bacterium]|nr:hypothetical protein [Myxococcota bacterium]